MKKTARYFAARNFCRNALAKQVDLSSLKEKPSSSALLGLGLLVFSYIIGLPAAIFLGAVAVWWKEPLIGAIGIPLIYGISTVIFIVGLKLSGKKYIEVLAGWFVRVTLEKILGEEVKKFCASQTAVNQQEK